MIKVDEMVTTPFGKIPKYQDCKRCGVKLSCKFDRVAYSQPCDNCKNTKEYEIEQQRKSEEMRGFGITQAFAAQQPAAVWNIKGRNVYTNNKGDIIKDEPYKPLKTGRIEKKKTYL